MAQYASVDVGSNAVRLLVGEVSGTGVLSRVRFERRFTRLAEGLHERRRLSGPAMRRALTALKLYSNIIASYNDGICAVRAVGTHALREAGNSGEFVRSVKAESGLTVEVIGTEEEAGLMALGAVSSFDVKGGALVLDIGGGSTEWALLAGGGGGAGGARGRISGTSSVPLGVIGLVQRHIKSDPPSEGELVALDRELSETASGIADDLKGMLGGGEIFVLTAGTASSIAAIQLGLESLDYDRLHGLTVGFERIKELSRRLAAMTLGQRRALRGLEPERADLIIPGVRLTIMVMEALGFGECTISGRGLPDGVVLGLSGHGAL